LGPSLKIAAMNPIYKIEACVETFDEALAAQQRGADQIELCSRLDLDGLSPASALIQKCKSGLNLDIKVMIRPRSGDFTYSDEEISQMKQEILFCKETGVTGVVFGILTKNNNLDIAQIKELAIVAKPLTITIHKAIDQVTDIIQETKQLLTIHEHIDTILTSGGPTTAIEGIPILKEMINICKGKIEIMPAGTVTQFNLESIHKKLNTSAYHGRKIVGDLSKSSNQ